MGQPKKRGEVYYANTRVGSVRLRDCLNTENWQEALRRQKELVEKVEAGQITAVSSTNHEWLKYTLSQALDILIEERKKEKKSERTLQCDRERAKQIKDHTIASQKVHRLTAEMITEYQAARDKEGVGGRTINMEVTLIRLVLKKARRWARIADGVKNRPENRDVIARVLTQDEKHRLFEIAASKEDWYRALYAAVIAVNTTGRKIEVLRSQLRDVDFFRKVWTIPQSKTRAGISVESISTKRRCTRLRI